jgi:hypothetical protein
VCGVIAVAVAAGQPFGVVWDMMAELEGPRWRGASTFTMQCCVLYALGVRWQHLTTTRRMTLARWSEKLDVPGRTSLVTAGNHVMVVRDGLVLDQAGECPVDLHPNRRCIVEDILVLKELRK